MLSVNKLMPVNLKTSSAGKKVAVNKCAFETETCTETRLFSETAIDIAESVRGKEVYIIQTGTK